MNWTGQYYVGLSVKCKRLFQGANSNYHWEWVDGTVVRVEPAFGGLVYVTLPGEGLTDVGLRHEYIRPAVPFDLDTHNLEEIEAWLNSATV